MLGRPRCRRCARLALSAAHAIPAGRHRPIAAAIDRHAEPPSRERRFAGCRRSADRLAGKGGARCGSPRWRRRPAADPDPTVRSACLLSLCRVAPAEDAVAALRQVLRQDAQANLRGLAAMRLGKLGQAAAAAAPELAEALADRDEGVRRKAADALAVLGPAAVAPTMQKLDAAGRRRPPPGRVCAGKTRQRMPSPPWTRSANSNRTPTRRSSNSPNWPSAGSKQPNAGWKTVARNRRW